MKPKPPSKTRVKLAKWAAKAAEVDLALKDAWMELRFHEMRVERAKTAIHHLQRSAQVFQRKDRLIPEWKRIKREYGADRKEKA